MDVKSGNVAFNNDNDAVVSGGLTIEQAASLVGSGIISSNVTNAGSITIPGSGTVQTLTINGSYTQTATGTLSLTLSGATSDPLTVNGQVSLAGTLDVGYADGFTLHPGQNFALINCGSALSGTFGTVDLPSGTDLQYPTPPAAGKSSSRCLPDRPRSIGAANRLCNGQRRLRSSLPAALFARPISFR